MTPDQLKSKIDDIQKLERAAAFAGHYEYASDDDSLSHFKDGGSELGINPRISLMVLARKHWIGIQSYLRGHKSQRENIRGRIKDLRLYLALLWAPIDETEGVSDPSPLDPWQDVVGPSDPPYDSVSDRSAEHTSGPPVFSTLGIPARELRTIMDVGEPVDFLGRKVHMEVLDAQENEMTVKLTRAYCHADRDVDTEFGECDWNMCPQLRDGEPAKTGRHCPLDHPCT